MILECYGGRIYGHNTPGPWTPPKQNPRAHEMKDAAQLPIGIPPTSLKLDLRYRSTLAPGSSRE
jgi:hypothetical protein